MSLTRDDLLGRKANIQKVHIKSMNQDVYVREFVVAERNKLRNIPNADFQAITLILGVCDKEGVGLFTADDIEAIGQMPQVVSDELLMAVMDINEHTQEESAKN